MRDEIFMPKEWIGGLLLEYSPEKRQVNIAIQNMGVRIKQLERHIDDNGVCLACLKSYHYCECNIEPNESKRHEWSYQGLSFEECEHCGAAAIYTPRDERCDKRS